MTKIYTPARGVVITNDDVVISTILREGGRIILKNREINALIGADVESFTEPSAPPTIIEPDDLVEDLIEEIPVKPAKKSKK